MKADQRFRGNLHLLSASHSIRSCAHAAAGNCPDGRAFTATQRAHLRMAPTSRASTGLNRRILSSAIALLAEGVGHDIHRGVIHRIDPVSAQWIIPSCRRSGSHPWL